jgi:hypothetical protein
MDESFFLYLDRLELMAFFSGYALVYLFIRSIGDTEWIKKITTKNITSFLPHAYALVGMLYLGLQLKNLYPDYTWANIAAANAEPYLKIWGLLSILFFMPALNKKIIVSLWHSLVFFFFLAKDITLHFIQSTEKDVVNNDMKIYTISLLINLASFTFIVLVYFLYTRFTKQKAS